MSEEDNPEEQIVARGTWGGGFPILDAAVAARSIEINGGFSFEGEEINFWSPTRPQGVWLYWEYDYIDKLTDTNPARPFHLRTYRDKPINTLECRLCGGDQFQIGRADYETVARCVKCGYEVLIHSG